MVLLPFVGAILQAFVPQTRKGTEVKLPRFGRGIALATSLLSGLCGIALVISMKSQTPDLQGLESLPWIGAYAISYEMGVDGLNALLVLLVSILFPILIAAEWDRKLGARGMHALLLLLQASFLGAVCAQDLFLQFFFWSFTALPFYFLIGIWGGEEREKAAFRLVVSSTAGNALLFGALILIYYSVEPHTFLLKELASGGFSGKTLEMYGYDVSIPAVAFALISGGLALRAPIWPLHGWFTQAAEEAPPSVLVALSAVTAPVASYLFIRLTHSLFPDTLASAAPLVVLVGGLNLVLGGILAVAQRGLRSLHAFVCLGQMGLLLLGVGSLSSAGLVGAVYHQLVLGLGLAGFGLLSGVITERSGHGSFLNGKGDPLFGGIAVQAPTVALVAGIVLASLLGLPGLGGFVAQSLVVIGSYAIHPGIVVLTGLAALLAAYYLLTMYRYVFLGKASPQSTEVADLSWRERLYMFPVVFGLLAFGIYPKPLLDLVRPTALTLLSMVKS